MSKEYDGWVIKNLISRHPFYLMWTFNSTRKEAIQEFEESWHTNYSVKRKKGEFKAVKIKLTEVE